MSRTISPIFRSNCRMRLSFIPSSSFGRVRRAFFAAVKNFLVKPDTKSG